MKKLSLSLSLFYLLLASLSLSADPLLKNSRSNATPLLNDSFSPGLPHLAVLKKKNNVAGIGGYATGKVKISGFEAPNSALNDEVRKITETVAGLDVNYTPNWDWGYNFNALNTSLKIVPEKNEKTGTKTSQTNAEFNLAGHYNWTLLYGISIGKDIYEQTDKDASGVDKGKTKYDHTPITVSLGYRLDNFFFGLGATSFQENETYTNKAAPDLDHSVSGSVVMPKIGLGWNSGGIFEDQYQWSYSFTSLPKQKANKGAYFHDGKQRHDLNFEFQTGTFQTGLYLTYIKEAKSDDFESASRYGADLAFSYAPLEGHLASLILTGTQYEQNLPEIGDSKPKIKANTAGARLSYGYAFF